MATAGRGSQGKSAGLGEILDAPDTRLIAEAERLGVSWREILGREIALARARRRYEEAEASGSVLWRTLAHLPNALLPPPDRRRRDTGADPFSEASWIVYLRVLELEHLARLAERLAREPAIAGWRLRSRTGCQPEDARWAIARAGAPPRERGPCLDDAVARARAEGLELPAAGSGREAVRRLQRQVRRRLAIRRRRTRS